MEGGKAWILLNNRRLHNLVSFFSLCLSHSSVPLFLFSFYTLSVCLYLSDFLPASTSPPPIPPLSPYNPPPSFTPSLFLANLKFVRRLRLLDGWPLIFCQLHLAQTSLRPWCILLTAALVAGPRHLSQPWPPNAYSLQEPQHQLNPHLSADCAHANTLKNSQILNVRVCVYE